MLREDEKRSQSREFLTAANKRGNDFRASENIRNLYLSELHTGTIDDRPISIFRHDRPIDPFHLAIYATA